MQEASREYKSLKISEGRKRIEKPEDGRRQAEERDA